jgi:hypothetical protein
MSVEKDSGFVPSGSMIVQEQLGTLTAQQVNDTQDVVAGYAVDSPGQLDTRMLFDVLGLPLFRLGSSDMWLAGDPADEEPAIQHDIRSMGT